MYLVITLSERKIGPKVYLYLVATWVKKKRYSEGCFSEINMLSYSSYTVVVLTGALGVAGEGKLFLRAYLDLFRDIFVVTIREMLLTFGEYRLCLDSG